MDPDANLAEIRRMLKCGRHDTDYCSRCGLPVDANRLLDLVEALDDWITNGGFLPRAWSNTNTNRK